MILNNKFVIFVNVEIKIVLDNCGFKKTCQIPD